MALSKNNFGIPLAVSDFKNIEQFLNRLPPLILLFENTSR